MIPCEKCITFAICNAIVQSWYKKYQTLGYINLHSRCELIREYPLKYRSEMYKLYDVFGIDKTVVFGANLPVHMRRNE